MKAIEMYDALTCIRFIPKAKHHKDYVKFEDGGYGSCYSYVGRQGGVQEISIGDGCHYHVGIVLHEMAHTLGFLHEHNRPDRDDYITVKFENIHKAKTGNFDKNPLPSVELYGLRYDYGSMMHYGKSYFSQNGLDTIITKDITYRDKIGQRQNFSICDLEKINKHYGCEKYLRPDGPCKIAGSSRRTTMVASTIQISTDTCQDDPDFHMCQYVQIDPSVCDRLPGTFLMRCKKSCDNCQNEKCYDSSTEGSRICQNPYFKNSCDEKNDLGEALRMFCPKTCGACTGK